MNDSHKPLEGLFSAEVGDEFIVGKVLDLVNLSKNYPTKKLRISRISDIPHHSNPKESFYIMNSSLDYPIIVMVDEHGEVKRVLDGNHRVQKSLYLGNDTIKAKLIPEKDIKEFFGKSNLQESIRRILREEFQDSDYPICLKRRTSQIKEYLHKEMSKLSCKSCFWGFESFILDVFKGVILKLSTELDFLEYEYDDNEYDDDDEPLYNEDREIVEDYIEKKYGNLLKSYFDDFCKKCNKKTSIS